MPAEPGKAAKGRGKLFLPPEGLWGRTQPPTRPLNQTLRLHHLPATACDVRGPVPGPGLRSREGRCCETKGETRLRRRVSFSGRPHFHLCPPRPSHTQSTGCSKLHLPGEVRGLPGGGPGPLSIPAAAGSLVARGTRPTTASWKEALLPQVRPPPVAGEGGGEWMPFTPSQPRQDEGPCQGWERRAVSKAFPWPPPRSLPSVPSPSMCPSEPAQGSVSHSWFPGAQPATGALFAFFPPMLRRLPSPAAASPTGADGVGSRE